MNIRKMLKNNCIY